MNAISHIQARQILRPAVHHIALLVSAVLLPLASLAPAATIDQSFQYDALKRILDVEDGMIQIRASSPASVP